MFVIPVRHTRPSTLVAHARPKLLHDWTKNQRCGEIGYLLVEDCSVLSFGSKKRGWPDVPVLEWQQENLMLTTTISMLILETIKIAVE